MNSEIITSKQTFTDYTLSNTNIANCNEDYANLSVENTSTSQHYDYSTNMTPSMGFSNLDHLDLCLPINFNTDYDVNLFSNICDNSNQANKFNTITSNVSNCPTSNLTRSLSTPSCNISSFSKLRQAQQTSKFDNSISINFDMESNPSFILESNSNDNDYSNGYQQSKLLTVSDDYHTIDECDTHDLVFNSQHIFNQSNETDKIINETFLDLKTEWSQYYSLVFTCIMRSCGNDFEEKDLLINHLILKHKIKIDSDVSKYSRIVYKCKYSSDNCGRKLDSINQIINHIYKIHIISHSDDINICTYPNCCRSYKSTSALNIHKLTHRTNHASNLKQHTCDVCNSKFVRPAHLKDHMKLHMNDNNLLKCVYCDEKFIKNSALIQHLHQMHKEATPKIKCPQIGCDKEFISNFNLQSHYKKVHENRNDSDLKCSFCDKLFQAAWLKRQHEDNVHKGIRLYQCTYENCEKSFKSSSKLSRHTLTHSNPKQFKCEHNNCKATFNRKDHLKAHSKTHSHIKTFKCEYPNCNSAFKHSNNLQAHKKTHLQTDKEQEIIFNNLKADFLKFASKSEIQNQLTKNDSMEELNLNFDIESSDICYKNDKNRPSSLIQDSNVEQIQHLLKKPKDKHVININSDDEEYAPTSVVLENISGSARTDYKSNHIYIERNKLRLQNERISINFAKRNVP